MPARLSGGSNSELPSPEFLANDPQVLLVDEPTAALDSQRARQVMELFAKIAHEQNAGVIVVTHDHRFLDVFGHYLRDGRWRASRTKPLSYRLIEVDPENWTTWIS